MDENTVLSFPISFKHHKCIFYINNYVNRKLRCKNHINLNLAYFVLITFHIYIVNNLFQSFDFLYQSSIKKDIPT